MFDMTNIPLRISYHAPLGMNGTICMCIKVIEKSSVTIPYKAKATIGRESKRALRRLDCHSRQTLNHLQCKEVPFIQIRLHKTEPPGLPTKNKLHAETSLFKS